MSHPWFVVGLSGLRWRDVSAARTPALWRLAGQGSVGTWWTTRWKPLTCPPTLLPELGPRAQSEHTNDLLPGAFPACQPACVAPPSPCPALPRDLQPPVPQQPLLGPAVPADPGLCQPPPPRRRAGPWPNHGRPSVALPPGPPAGPTRAVLARCPADRFGPGHARSPNGPRQLSTADAQLARSRRPSSRRHHALVPRRAAPDQAASPATALADGPGYSRPLTGGLHPHPGLVVAHRPERRRARLAGPDRPAQTVGAHITRGAGLSLASTVPFP